MVLDAARGWAAIVVLVFHLCHEMFGAELPEFHWPIWKFPLNGALAVCVFFVISGDVLSYGYFRSGDAAIVRRLAIKRYLRLTIPIFFSCLLVYGLMRFHLVFSQPAAQQITNSDWLGSMLPFAPDFRGMLTYSLFRVYSQVDNLTSYNTFLWSMNYEMFGSILVFLILLICRDRKGRWMTYLLLAVLLLPLRPPMICFIGGMVCAELRAHGVFERLREDRAGNRIAVVAIAGVAMPLSMLAVPGTIGNAEMALAAIAILVATNCCGAIQRGLDNRLSDLVGRLSFPIYLVQFPVIVSLQSFLVLTLTPAGPLSRIQIYAIVAAGFITSVTVAFAFLPIERLAMRSADRFYQLVMRIAAAMMRARPIPVSVRRSE